VAIDNKLATLNREWDAVVAAFAQKALASMEDMDEYLRRSLPDEEGERPG
jgi:hypothetical protein